MKWWDSPYINHFVSADTIVSSYANPQNLNRYTYVTNNPLRYTDPTGHTVACNPMEDDCHDPDPAPTPTPDDGGGGDHCNNNPDCEAGRGHDEGGIGPICYPGELACQIAKDGYDGYNLSDFCPLSYTLVECYNKHLPLYMGNGPLYIDPIEWNALLSALRGKVDGKSIWWILVNATSFDTPFYDRSVYGLGKLSGTGCVDGKCYDRSELNYIAEGELWAAAGASKRETHFIVWVWKLSPIMHWPTIPSEGTIDMTDLGHDDYHGLYP